MRQKTNRTECWSLGCPDPAETPVHVPGDEMKVEVCDHHADRFTSVGPWVLSEKADKEVE